MKKLLILLFSLLISFNSYGEWREVARSTSGDTFYVEQNTIRENNGYVYSWILIEYAKSSDGMMSSKIYTQFDCGVFRFKDLAFVSYNQSMGNGEIRNEFTPPDDWRYPMSKTMDYAVLDFVCD